MMKTRSILAGLLAILVASMIVIPAGTAEAVNWLKPGTTSVSVFNWNDTANWQDIDADTIGDVPGIGGLTDVEAAIPDWHLTQDVTLNVDQAVDLGTGKFYVGTRYYDMTIADSSGTGSASLTCGTYVCWRSWEYTICQIPIYASEEVQLGWRWGYMRFENIVETPLVRCGDGDMTFTALPNPGDVYKFDTVLMWDDQYITTPPEVYVHAPVDPYTPGTPLSITVSAGGIYGGYADGAFGTLPGNTVDATAAGVTVIVGAAQTNFPDVVVGAASALTGDFTGLAATDFGLAGSGRKIIVGQDSVLARNVGTGADPVRGDIGGAILVKGVVDTASGTPTVVGDDGISSVYYAAGFGGWGSSTAINTTAQALAGSGDLGIFVTGRNADMGAATGLESSTQVAKITVPPGAGYVNLVGPINNGVVTSPKATTFNVVGEANGKEHNWVFEISDAGGEIAVGQTFNVQNGMVWLDTGANTTFLKGTLDIDAGGGLRNGNTTTALAASGGTIAFKDRSLLFLAPGQDAMFENVNVTESGTPFIVIGTDADIAPPTTHTIVDGTELGDLVKASNLWLSARYNWNPITFDGPGVLLGDGKWMQTIDSVTRDVKVAGVVRADPGTTIGFASMGVTRNRIFTIDADIQAAGATVLFNTTETLETSVYLSVNTAGNHHTNNRRVDTVVPNRPINVSGSVTAETIKAQNGPVTLQQDLNVPNLDIAGGASVAMASGKTATVTNTLSGKGSFTGGNGVVLNSGATVAPGAGAGTLSGNILNMNTGSTYACEFADETLVAGDGWDLIALSGLLTLANPADDTEKWTFDVVDLGGSPDAATEYKVFEYGTLDAANDLGTPAKLTGVTITNSSGGYYVNDAGLYINSSDNSVYITGLVGLIPVIDVEVPASTTVEQSLQTGQVFGNVTVHEGGALTVLGTVTDVQVTNLTLESGSMVKSAATAASAPVTITLVDGGKLSAAGGISSLGDAGSGDQHNTNLTLAAGASFDWTFTKNDAAVDEWLGDRVFVNGELDLADGLEIHLVDGGGSSGVGGVDVALFQIQAGGAPFNAGQIIIDAPGLDWTWGELEYFNEEWVILRGLVTGPKDGDANNDGKVDHLDLGLFDQQFGLKGSDLSCDFNNDDVVGIDDLAILRANFGWVLPTAPGGASSPTGTPEPATMTVLALSGLVVLRRRRKP